MTRHAEFRPSARDIRFLHDHLLGAYGRQGWWPGETRLEILVGAMLTQNTAWINVEKAIRNLKEAGALESQVLLDMPAEALAMLIRPAGYFNVKTKRLRNLLQAIARSGGEARMAGLETTALRSALLAVNGIGPETADDILLYAFGRPVFVIDAYTRRLFKRLGWMRGDEGYETLRRGVERAAGPETRFLQELHALIVTHAKTTCRKVPGCERCILREHCCLAGSGRGLGIRSDR